MTLYGDILSLAKEKMEANAQKILIVDDTGSYTYGDFVRRAISVAVFLSVKGVHKGSKIGILQADYYEFFATLFGIWLAGV